MSPATEVHEVATKHLIILYTLMSLPLHPKNDLVYLPKISAITS